MFRGRGQGRGSGFTIGSKTKLFLAAWDLYSRR